MLTLLAKVRVQHLLLVNATCVVCVSALRLTDPQSLLRGTFTFSRLITNTCWDQLPVCVISIEMQSMYEARIIPHVNLYNTHGPSGTRALTRLRCTTTCTIRPRLSHMCTAQRCVVLPLHLAGHCWPKRTEARNFGRLLGHAVQSKLLHY